MAHVREVDRKSGRRAYEVRWREEGKFRQQVFHVKREAERFARRVDFEIAAGHDIRPLARSRITVHDAIEAVLAADQHRLRPRTLDSYRKLYGARVSQKFGTRRLNAVSRDDVQSWVSELVESGLASGTVKHHYVALRKLFAWGIEERHIAFDPCKYVSLPRAEFEHDYPILTLAEIDRLAATLEATPPYGSLVRFMALTGLRAGEVAGLRVTDVEVARRRVLVRRTVQRIKGRGWVLGAPKSKRSTREVPLLDRQLISDLQKHLLSHPKSRQPDALFWPGRAPGSREMDFDRVLDNSTLLRNYFKPALSRAGLPQMRIHDLRHTAASIWLAAGFPTYQVSRWLGHANVSTTDAIYSHLYASDYEGQTAQFDAYRRSVGEGRECQVA